MIALLLLAACASDGRLAVPVEIIGGRPIGTSAGDVWWMACDDAGNLAPFRGTQRIVTGLPCEPVSATPAGPNALWIAGSTALIRLDASGAEEDHTAEVHVDGGYSPVRVASHGEHAYALVVDDPEGRMFALDGDRFVPAAPSGIAAVPVTVHADGSMWAQATVESDCGATDDGADGWFCGEHAASGGLRWDGAAWHRSSLGFTVEIDFRYPGLRPVSGSFASDDVWMLASTLQTDGLVLHHWDGLAWRLIELPAAPIQVDRVVAGPSGLVAFGATNIGGGADLFGNQIIEHDIAVTRWQHDGWGSARIVGFYQAIAGPTAWVGELEDGTWVTTAGDSDRKLYPIAIAP